MSQIHPAFVEYQRKRFTRPDAARYLLRGSGPRSHLSGTPSGEFKFNPDQPRVPAGNPDGGQWTTGESGGFTVAEDIKPTGITDSRVLSDAAPDPVEAGTQYAQNRARGPISTLINGRPVQLTPGQEAALTAAQSRAEGAIARVRELDRDWRPPTSLYETVEGQIQHYRVQAEQAQARIGELSSLGIGQGPFAAQSIPARGTGQTFSAAERELINNIGRETGCHTCGTRDPGTISRNFVPDHQIPSALNPIGRPQRLFPQCLSCSTRQGGLIKGLK